MELEKCAICGLEARIEDGLCDCPDLECKNNGQVCGEYSPEIWNERQIKKLKRPVLIERMLKAQQEVKRLRDVIKQCASGCPYPECRIDHEKWGRQVCSYSCPQSRLTAKQFLAALINQGSDV